MTPLDFDTLLAHYHAEVWEAAAEENGKIAYDEAGVDTAKKLCKGYADLERQVAALTNERNEWKTRLQHQSATEFARWETTNEQLVAAQAVNEKLREAVDKAAKHVRPTCSELYVTLSKALALPDDTAALDARLKDEREKVLQELHDLGALDISGEFAIAIRSMK